MNATNEDAIVSEVLVWAARNGTAPDNVRKNILAMQEFQNQKDSPNPIIRKILLKYVRISGDDTIASVCLRGMMLWVGPAQMNKTLFTIMKNVYYEEFTVEERKPLNDIKAFICQIALLSNWDADSLSQFEGRMEIFPRFR